MSTTNREAYQLPTSTPSAQHQPTAYTPSYGAGTGGAAGYGSSGGYMDPPRVAVTYTCGECASKVALNLGDAIRCKECGHRVLYKERTKR